ncbi:MAG: hypothetical protein CL517_05845 [Actinobacteria bacterium]|nr:hypothetical protein [Actinomycetota bacterium]MEC7810605.1 cytochrome c oxidase subunit 3 [Actinomycetota bacterium]
MSEMISPPLPSRPRTLVTGAVLGSIASVMFFAGLLAIYFSMRADAIAWGSEWFPEGAIQLVPGGMNMATMSLSVITMAWAVRSVSLNDRIHTYLALGLTALLGVAMINQTVFYLNDIGLPVDYSKASTLLFTIVGAHMIMVAIGVIWSLLLLVRAFGGQDTRRHQDLVSALSIYWYAGVVIYSIIWIGIYIAK